MSNPDAPYQTAQDLQSAAVPPPLRQQWPIVGPSSAVTVEPSPLMRLIETAARDQSIPLDRLRPLIDWAREDEAERKELAFDRAMTAAQAEITAVVRGQENKETKSTFASYDELDAMARPIYTSHGFAISYDIPDPPTGDKILLVVAIVRHSLGHKERFTRHVPVRTTGPKGTVFMTDTHATMSAESYGMRYLLKGIFNIPTKDKEDDGNTAGRGDTITAEQAQEILDLIAAAGIDEKVVYDFCGVDNVSHIRADQFGGLKKKLSATKAKRAKK